MERFFIHHDCNDVWKQRPELGKNLETVSIKIAPVENGTIGEPVNGAELIHHEAASKESKSVAHGWQREECHLIFYHDTALAVQIEREKLRTWHGEFG